MATGIIGILGPSASLTYTSTVDAKVLISAVSSTSGSASVSLNGSVAIYLAGLTSGNVTHYLGAGQTLNVVNSLACSSIVSALEGS